MRTDEVEKTVQSIAKRAATQPTTSSRATPVKGGFEVTHINDFMAAHGDHSESWVIDEWLPEGAVTFLVAPPESYKTWLLLDLALAIATGSPFLGKYPVHLPGPVILVQQEDHKAGVASRLSKIWHARFRIRGPREFGEEFDVPEAEVPIWVHETRSLRLDSQESIAALGAQVEKIRPRAVLIDPLYSTLSTDDYMAGAAEQMLALKTLRDQTGCAFVIAHHTRKKQDEGRLGAWGSQFLNAFIETGWQIRRTEEEETVSVIRHHKTAKRPAPLTLRWRIEDNDYGVEVAGLEEVGDPTQAILTALASQPYSIQGLADVTKVHRSTISRRLAGMAKDGMVQKSGQNWLLVGDTPAY